MQPPEIETVSPSGIASTLPLAGFSEVADRFDLCLCDVWGVVHNGVAAYRDAVAALMRMREHGISVVLVTNAPRPADVIVGQLDGFAVPREAWDAIVTSGDVCRALIRERAGEPMFRLGPDRDLPLIAGLDVRETSPRRLPMCSAPACSTTKRIRLRPMLTCSPASWRAGCR